MRNFSIGSFALEGYPNRESTDYADRYGIPEAKTILRGTLRYKGTATVLHALSAIGLLGDMEQKDYLAEVGMICASPLEQIPLAWSNV